MQRIFLIGFMGAGKTTAGKALSELMNCSFVDLDYFIERRYRKTIRQIFVEQGETCFRDIEQKMLREVAEFEDVVISTGGGTPCYHHNMRYMNEKGTTVYLKVTNSELVRRIGNGKSTRPMLKDFTGEKLANFVDEMMDKRREFYEQAHVIVEVEARDIVSDASTLYDCLKSLKSSS
ncbi:MAG: shikimate kinase [Tannerella sp.]|jgi:shikimate kinase|nr:shikimate kinase [Tannerella sp.]